MFAIIVATITPVYISPLFNTYKSLPESPLKVQILSTTRANGIPATNVYWFDASRQSKRIRANVSRMFGTTRISLNDNLLKRSSPREVKAVLGHEMGHYVLNHVYKGIVFFGIIIVLAFAFVRWGFGWAERRWGLHGAGDVQASDALMADFARYRRFHELPGTPISNSVRSLILSITGRAAPLTATGVYLVVKDALGRVADVLEPTDATRAARLRHASTHWLRHTAATHQAEAWNPLHHIQHNLRHSSIATTSIYLHAEEDARHDSTTHARTDAA